MSQFKNCSLFGASYFYSLFLKRGNGSLLNLIHMHPYSDFKILEDLYLDFPGSPMVKIPHFKGRGHGLDPWLRN